MWWRNAGKNWRTRVFEINKFISGFKWFQENYFGGNLLAYDPDLCRIEPLSLAA